MDPVLLSVLVNLLSQSIWEAGIGSAASVIELAEERPLDQAVRAAASRVLADVPEADVAVIASIFQAPETRGIVRALYLQRLTDQDTTPTQARVAFEAVCERAGLVVADGGCERLYYALLESCGEVLDAAINEGVLTALDAKAALRHKLLAEQLDAIQRRLDHAPVTPADVDRFERALVDEMAVRTAHVEPPDFYGAPRVPIDRLYVAPELTVLRRDGERSSFQLIQWQSLIRHAVVLGNPGAGKSTLATKICHDVATRYEECLLAGRRLAPFIVTLREYGASKKDHSWSVSDYIADFIHTRLQLTYEPELLEFMLLAGRMFVVFDGLDELLETRHRKEIREDVESFSRRYPNVPVLVTSREVGYEQAPLTAGLFDVARLADFDIPRVRDYAAKWFALEQDLSAAEQQEKAEAFVRESNGVADLRSNPLMLALMCNFYKGQNYIPRNRPDVYDKCARMLFDTWDRQRDIKADLPIEEHIEPAMQFLARWIYEDERRQGGVTESELVEQAAAFLSEHRFDDPHRAAHAARAFIEFCRDRAWVFSDTGSTDAGEPLYQFTHRTFLEYFTARYLVATNATAAELSKLVLPRVESGGWDVIAQLAYHIKARATIGDADVLLALLLDRVSEASAPKSASLLAFAARCLQFLVPKPATVRQLVSGTTEALRASATAPATGRRIQLTDSLGTALGTLMVARTENIDAVKEGLVTTLVAGCHEARPEAVELVLSLQRPLRRWGPDEHILSDEGVSYWREVERSLREECSTDILAVAEVNPAVELSAWRAGIVDLAHFIEHHGVIATLDSHPNPLWPRTIEASISDHILRAVLTAARRRNDLDFALISEALLDLPTPWVGRSTGFRGGLIGLRPRLAGPAPRSGTRVPDGNEWFVTFGILALRLETLRRRGSGLGERFLGTVRSNLAPQGGGTRESALEALGAILEVRAHDQGSQAGTVPGSLSAPQRDLVTAWRDREISFVGAQGTGR